LASAWSPSGNQFVVVQLVVRSLESSVSIPVAEILGLYSTFRNPMFSNNYPCFVVVSGTLLVFVVRKPSGIYVILGAWHRVVELVL
jgi:hypothetical protein